MVWVKVDDAAPLHHKQLRAGPDACWLWLCGLCYANRHTTNGAIPAEALSALYPVDEWSRAKLLKLAERLVKVRLWDVRTVAEGGGWTIRGYAEYQEEAMSDAVEERRNGARARKREQRKREKSRATDPPSRVTGRDKSHEESHASHGTPARDARPPLSQAPGPARPVPSTNTDARVRDPEPGPPPVVTPEMVEAARPAFLRSRPVVIEETPALEEDTRDD